MISRSRVLISLVALLVLFLSFTPQTIMAAECSNRDEHWGMPGGFSAPHEPTAEEKFLLKKTYFEATSKCSHMPKEFERVKICSVSRQVVAGMNYAYTLEDDVGKTFKIVIYVPLPGNAEGRPERVTTCEMISSGETSKSS